MKINLDDLDDLEAVATKHPYISAIHAPTVLTLITRLREAEQAFERHKRMEPKRAIAKLREAEAVIERARGWAEKPIPGLTLENQMAEVADALAAYEPTNNESEGDDGT